MRKLFRAATGTLVAFGLAGCGEPTIAVVSERRVMMDTMVSISVYAASGDSATTVRSDIARAFAAISRVDSLMSSYRHDSEVAAINRSAGKGFVPISAALDSVLQTAAWAARVSGGAFDISIAPVLQLWGFGTDSVALPDTTRLRDRVRLVNFRCLEKRNGAVRFLQPGMAIDLGGVAKGFAVDAAVAVLNAAGYRDVMVAAGGDLRIVSSPRTPPPHRLLAELWKRGGARIHKGLRQRNRHQIWIQHPRAADKFFAKFPLDNGAVATSGDYERFFEHGGVRYHHVLDPLTGYPARQAVMATVLAKDCRAADALATAMMVLGPERGVALADSLSDVESVIVSMAGGKLAWRASAGLAGILEIIDDAAHP